MKVSVTVKAGSSQNKVVDVDGNVVVYTSKRAHDGEANAAVVKMLAEYYRVSKSQVSIVSGEKSKHKIVEIS